MSWLPFIAESSTHSSLALSRGCAERRIPYLKRYLSCPVENPRKNHLKLFIDISHAFDLSVNHREGLHRYVETSNFGDEKRPRIISPILAQGDAVERTEDVAYGMWLHRLRVPMSGARYAI